MNNINKNRDYLINIAKKLQKTSQSIPIDETGEPTEAYIEYLNLMYNPKEAEIIQHLEVFPKNVSLNKLAKFSGHNKQEIMDILDPLSEKGFITKMGKTYSIPMPLEIFDLPFMLKKVYTSNEAEKFAQLSKSFFEGDEYYRIWETTEMGIPRTRILTVSEKIEPTRDILPIEEVYNIIEKNTSFAIVPCPCRNRMEIEGNRKCKDKYPIHNCVLLGEFAEKVLSLGDPIVKRATREDVIKLSKEASELGLVHTTDNYAFRSNILCHCCECCCVMLAGLTRSGLDNPKAIAKANFIAIIDENSCAACGTCLDRCKFKAITIENTAIIDENKCMGCGLCAFSCPNNAIIMKRCEREEISEEQVYI